MHKHACMPPSVPAECVDMLPREMWPVYWEMFPDGRQELPATVPPHLWRAHMKKRCRDNDPPPPPPIWKSYWGRVSTGPALTDRSKKPKPTDEPQKKGPPAGPEPPLPDRFWDRYFEIFPYGHCAPARYEPLDGKPAYDEVAAILPRYLSRRGTICVRISADHEAPVYVASTGCDALDESGNWIGPG